MLNIINYLQFLFTPFTLSLSLSLTHTHTLPFDLQFMRKIRRRVTITPCAFLRMTSKTITFYTVVKYVLSELEMTRIMMILYCRISLTVLFCISNEIQFHLEKISQTRLEKHREKCFESGNE
jgi:hypothetical protein